MRKLVFVFIACLLSLTMQAQNTNHLKFMGIPIDGKINDFKNELIKKGLRYKTQIKNSYLFDGYFAGDFADLFVMHDVKTKKVYGVGVSIDCYSEEIARDKYLNYVRDLTYKYNAMHASEFLDLYKDNPEDLYADIKTGKFSDFNIIRDSLSNEATIEMSRAVVLPPDSIIMKGPLGIMFLFLRDTGNVGKITVKYSEDDDYNGYKKGYKVRIIYADDKNTSEHVRKAQDDL